MKDGKAQLLEKIQYMKVKEGKYFIHKNILYILIILHKVMINDFYCFQ
jgi:hypothetical protein